MAAMPPGPRQGSTKVASPVMNSVQTGFLALDRALLTTHKCIAGRSTGPASAATAGDDYLQPGPDPDRGRGGAVAAGECSTGLSAVGLRLTPTRTPADNRAVPVPIFTIRSDSPT